MTAGVVSKGVPIKTESLTASESLILDVIRVLASIAVAASHIAQHFFSTGWPDLTLFADAAVAIFFVLSGFVIRHVTVRHPVSMMHYFSDRASRIYSVAIPALLFTWAADSLSRHLNPAFYNPWWGANASHPFFRIVENLVFTAELWFRRESPLSNSPFWSLNYEVIYYIIYGFAFYLSGRKRVFLVLLVLLIAVREYFSSFRYGSSDTLPTTFIRVGTLLVKRRTISIRRLLSA